MWGNRIPAIFLLNSPATKHHIMIGRVRTGWKRILPFMGFAIFLYFHMSTNFTPLMKILKNFVNLDFDAR